MRFITEFIVTEEELKYNNAPVIDFRKKRGTDSMGKMLSESFGWETPVLGDKNRYRLEIQAFPYDKWMKFKDDLRSYIEVAEKTGLATFNLIVVGKMLKELESFGNKTGEEKELSHTKFD